jgi:hypothetical protein
MLRKIHGLVLEQGIWEIRINQELSALYNSPNVKADKYKEEMGMG